MRSPICYYGGKGRLITKLIYYIPPHKTYVEVFGGAASLLFAKEPSPVEVYNDIDSNLVNLFRVLRDKEAFNEFYRLVSLTPYSREEYTHCYKNYSYEADNIKRAYMFFVALRQSFSARIKSHWSFKVTSSSKDMASSCSAWLSVIDSLPQIHQRLMRVQIEHDDFRKIIPRYDTPDTFFYLDPPYVMMTRVNKNCGYKHEMSDEDHIELIELLLKIKGKAMLSGYKNPIYEKLENEGWARVDFAVSCSAAGRTRFTKILGQGSASKKQLRVESIWVNPKCNERLWPLRKL